MNFTQHSSLHRTVVKANDPRKALCGLYQRKRLYSHACCVSRKDLQATWSSEKSKLPEIALASFLSVSVLLSGAPAIALPETSEPGSNAFFRSNDDVDQRRSKAHFRRAYDGRVALQSKVGDEWIDIKLDMGVPGTLLFRNGQGSVFYIAYEDAKQLDLSDDDIVSVVAAEDWEKMLQPIEGEDSRGVVAQLQLTREEFYSMLSLIEPILQQIEEVEGKK